MPDPTEPPSRDAPSFTAVIARNVSAISDLHQKTDERATAQDRIADTITRFTGSMLFVYIHLALIGGWVVVNLGWLGVKPFDPYPFGLLTMAGSLEAIFLSTFVLISQNRMAAVEARRADLDLHVNMLSEHELTQLIRLTHAIAQHLGIEAQEHGSVEEAMQDVKPEVVAAVIEQQERSHEAPVPPR